MALINCPDCGKPVSDMANVCTHCGLPVRARLAQLKREEEERLEEEEALQQRITRQRNISYGVLICIALAIILGIGSCISNASQHPVLLNAEAQGNLQPGENAFEAQGKLQIDYSCQSSNDRATTVQFRLVSMHGTAIAATVWKKLVTCTTIDQEGTDGTAFIQVAASTYDIGIVASASDTTWSISCTQA